RDDPAAQLTDYADTVVTSVGDRRELIVVGQSFGGFTAPLVADRLRADVLVFVAGMIPAPGEPPGDWWTNVGYSAAVRAQAARDGGLTGNDAPYITYLLPRRATRVGRGARAQSARTPIGSCDGNSLGTRHLARRPREVRPVHGSRL